MHIKRLLACECVIYISFRITIPFALQYKYSKHQLSRQPIDCSVTRMTVPLQGECSIRVYNKVIVLLK